MNGRTYSSAQNLAGILDVFSFDPTSNHPTIFLDPSLQRRAREVRVAAEAEIAARRETDLTEGLRHARESQQERQKAEAARKAEEVGWTGCPTLGADFCAFLLFSWFLSVLSVIIKSNWGIG